MAENNEGPDAKSWYGLSSTQRDWSQETIRLATLYSNPIILRSPANAAIYKSASGFLLKPGDRTYLVTNAHVMDDGYAAIEKQYGSASLTFGGRVLKPSVISQDSSDNVDLTILDVDGVEFVRREPGYWGSSAGLLETYVPPTWPLAAPKRGEAVIIIGWPQNLRKHDIGTVEFAAFPMGGQYIDAVNERWFSIPIERKDLIPTDFDPANPVQKEMAFGGISGGPVFALHREGVLPLQLVGIVRTYGEAFDVLYCTRADIIRVDGSIALEGAPSAHQG